MARTPLFAMLRRAAIKARPRFTRREFLKAAALGVAAAGAGCATTIDLDKMREGRGPRVVIVGAGLAGLSCAYELKKAGLSATVYEAAQRVGGRAFTKDDILGNGAPVDLGGEFIDAGQTEIIGLARELGVALVDLRRDGNVVEDALFFEGRVRKEAELAEALKPFAETFLKDAMLVPEQPEEPLAAEFAVRRTRSRKKIDAMSLTQYLDWREVKGWVRKLIEIAYVTEFGADADSQSALNLLSMFGMRGEQPEFFGEDAECLKFAAGAGALAQALEREVRGAIETDRRLAALRHDGLSYLLSFSRENAATLQVTADYVVLALPFTMLREVEMRLELPEAKKRAIAELGYGMGAKLCLGMKSAPWRAAGYSGGTISDLPFQLAWDNARMRGAAGLTFFLGGGAALELGKGTPREQVGRLLPEFEKVFPGTRDAFNTHFTRMHWPSHPFVRAAYSCYKPGQWTGLRGHESTPVGMLYFAGEHCSADWQGYMNGAVETGIAAAKGILTQVGEK